MCVYYLKLLLFLTKIPDARLDLLQANSNDDRGVLTGRWTEKFPKNSTVPWAWTGSVAILEKYMKRKRPVRFGQCWVFAGLVTTCE